jgi:muramoyltetrapeptide carboxypeptidase LdcA involved in peptidoglycan recycling
MEQQLNAYIKKLENILIDLLENAHSWHEIQYLTGLPKDRCQEIEDLFKKIIHTRNIGS